MSKYLEALKENEIIKKLIETFNIFLEEEISHRRKINKKKVFEFYSSKLGKEDWFNNCILDSLDDKNIYVLNSNGGSKREKSKRLHVVFFELDIKNRECKIRRASFFKRESKTIVAHSISYDNDIETLLISVKSRINGNSSSMSQTNGKVVVTNNVREDMDKCFKNNKEILEKVALIAKHNTKEVFDYLFLGKSLDVNFLELAILEHDVKLKAEDSIFKINLKDNKEDNLKRPLK